MIREKIAQAVDILKEKNIDMWLTFVRESDTVHDPCLDFILGTSCTWSSAFIITPEGETIAIVGSLDVANIESRGHYKKVVGYKESISASLLEVLGELDPQTIAINYSKDSPLSDGLTHGMYINLTEYLKGTPYEDRIISAEPVIIALHRLSRQFNPSGKNIHYAYPKFLNHTVPQIICCGMSSTRRQHKYTDYQ